MVRQIYRIQPKHILRSVNDAGAKDQWNPAAAGFQQNQPNQ